MTRRIATLLFLAGAVLLAWYFWNQRQHKLPEEYEAVQLPGQVTIAVKRGSFAAPMVAYLKDPADLEMPKVFVLDRIRWDVGTTKLLEESRPSLEALANILKAWPGVEGKLAGHTDAGGEAAANQKLSLERAMLLRDELTKLGINPARLAVEGYGGDKPIAPNDNEAGRARNNRMEFVVTVR